MSPVARSATRYDNTADSYPGFIHLASIRLWFRNFVNTFRQREPTPLGLWNFYHPQTAATLTNTAFGLIRDVG